MATIADLAIGLGVDPSGLTQGLDRAAAQVDAFGRRVASAFTGPKIDASALARQGTEAARAFTLSLGDAVSSRVRDLSAALPKGLVNEDAFRSRGGDAATSFGSGLVSKVRGVRVPKGDVEHATKPLVDKLGEEGAKAGDAFNKKFAERLKHLGEVADVAKNTGKLGLALTAGVTAPITGLGVAAISAADNLKKANRELTTLTGASGDRLKSLQESMEKLFKSSPSDISATAQALAMLNVRTGQIGEPLETLTKQFTKFTRATGASLPQTIEGVTRSFSAWGIATEHQSAELDFLYKLTQQTGVSMAQLTDDLSHFGPALQSAGFGFEQTAAMIANLGKAGADSTLILSRLVQSIPKFAAAGTDAAAGLTTLLTKIKEAKTDIEALNLATGGAAGGGPFDPRSAATLVAAVRSGQLAVDDLVRAVRASNQTLTQADASTKSFSASMGILRNNVEEALAPLGTSLTDAFKEMEPALKSAANALGSFIKWFAGLPHVVQGAVFVVAGFAAVLGPTVASISGFVLALVTMKKAAIAAEAALAVLKATEIGVGEAGAVAAVGTSRLSGVLTLLQRFGPAGIIVGGAIGTVIYAFRKEGEAARKAREETEKFRQSLEGVSRQRLEIDASALNPQIDELTRKLYGPKGLFAQERAAQAAGRGEEVAALNKQINSTLAILNPLISKFNVLQDAMKKQDEQTRRNAEDAVRFNKDVEALIAGAGSRTGANPAFDLKAKVDSKDAKSVIADLRGRIMEIEREMADPKNFVVDTTVAQAALSRLQDKINEIEASQRVDLSKLFGGEKVSEGVQALVDRVSRLVAISRSLPDTMRQWQIPGLAEAAVAALDDVNAALSRQSNQLGINAAALRQAQKDLEEFDRVRILNAVRRAVPASNGAGLAPIPLAVTPKMVANAPTLLMREWLAMHVPPMPVSVEIANAEKFKEDAKALLEKIASTPIFINLLPAADVSKFAALGKQLAAAQRAAADAALAGGDTAAQAKSALSAQQNVVRAAIDDFIRRAQRANLPWGQIVADIAQIGRILKSAGADVSDFAAGPTDQLVTKLHAAGDAAQRIGAAFHESVVTGIGAALDAVANFKQGLDSIGQHGFLNVTSGLAGIATAIGGAIGLISSAFGKSEAQRQFEAALNNNAQALRQMTASLDRFINTASGTAAAQRGVRALLQPDVFAQLLINGPSNPLFTDPGKLGEITKKALQGTGATWEQIQALAKQMGFTITDAKGRIDVRLLQDFATALGVSEKQLLDWGKSFDQSKRFLDLLSRAQGIEQTPLLGVQHAFEAFGTALGDSSNLLQRFFSGVTADSLKTAEGQAKLRSGIVALLQAIQNGQISLADLGNLSSVKDLDPIIGDLLDNLDQMSDATKKVTDSLLNVPQGFKVALARFNATAVEQAKTIKPPTIEIPPVTVPPEPPVVIPTPVLPRDVPQKVTFDDSGAAAMKSAVTDPMIDGLRRIEDVLAAGADTTDMTGGGFMRELADAISKARGGRGDVFQFGPRSIVIEGTTLTPEEMLAALTAAAQRKARAAFGTSTRASDVLNV